MVNRRRKPPGEANTRRLMPPVRRYTILKCALSEDVQDNLELERWLRLSKGHERRIHGRTHAGVRLVQEGATLVPVLGAHRDKEQPYRAEQLLNYRQAHPPREEQEAVRRRKIMRQTRSKKRRPVLLAELERRYRAAS